MAIASLNKFMRCKLDTPVTLLCWLVSWPSHQIWTGEFFSHATAIADYDRYTLVFPAPTLIAIFILRLQK